MLSGSFNIVISHSLQHMHSIALYIIWQCPQLHLWQNIKVKLKEAGVFLNIQRGDSCEKQITLIAMPKISLLCAFQPFSCGYG